MNFEHRILDPDSGHILELHHRYEQNLDSIDETTGRLFSQWKPTVVSEAAIRVVIDLRKLNASVNLAQANRSCVDLIAKFNPFNSHPASDPIIDLGIP